MTVLTGRRLALPARLAGAAALATTAAAHLWLYAAAGYRYIPTIGPSFVALSVAAVVLAAVVAARADVLVAATAAGFLLSVFVGWLLAATVGLFGFVEAGQVGAAALCGVAELGGAGALAAGALRALRGITPGGGGFSRRSSSGAGRAANQSA